MITANTQVTAFEPRVTLAQFASILETAGSPAAPEAAKAYSAVVTLGVSPAFILAIFQHESNYGREGFAAVNKSPGNTRSSMTGIGILTQTTKGPFIRYPNWAEGFRDLAWRLVKPDYVYVQEGRRTIEQIIERFAPKEDSNDPKKYVNAVITLMNKWIGGGEKVANIPTQADIGFPVRVHWAWDVGPDRPLSSVDKFVVHDTEGNMGSDEPVLANNDDNIVFTHALIAPSGELVFMVNLTQTAWTPGNDTVAKQSINVEMSGFQSKGYTDAQYKSMANFFKWCVAQGCPIPAEYVAKSGKPGILGHQDVANPFQPGKFGGASGHTDPGPLFQWGRFVALCKEGNVVPDYDPCMDYFNAHGGETVFGKPIGGQHGSTPGAVEREFEFAHLFLNRATNQVEAQMKDRTNPQGFKVGPGIYGKCKEHGLKLITNEMWFSPDPGQPGLGKMSRAWAQDAKGVTVVIMASEQPELKQPDGTVPWKVEVYELI